ncbi:MAG: extracellular solute-binding protein [bacterium]|nr:extracellular solute-binding protein [bacterium]
MKMFTRSSLSALLAAAALALFVRPTVLETAAQDTPELHILNWQGYGSDEPWAIAQFEEEFGVTIVHDYFTSLDEMLTKLVTSPGVYDAVEMNISYIQPALEDGLIQPIDLSLITAWEDIPENFRTLAELSQGEEGVTYAVPWTWGATSLVYNTEVFPEGVDSLDALWDPAYAGQVGMIDSYEEASIIAGLREGVENPASPTLENIGVIQESLAGLAPNVRTYWQSEDEFNRLFESGEITLGIYWSGSAGRARNAFDLPLEFVIPEEGAIGWVDVWTVAADAPNAELAHEWINFMNDPEFYAEWDSVAGAPVPANAEALAALPEDSYTRELFSDESILERLAFQTYIPADVRDELLFMWQEVKLLGS